MPSLKKLLSPFEKAESIMLENLIERIFSFKWHNLNVKKLKGYKNIFRLRKGKLRIIYQVSDQKEVTIFIIERCSEKTYKFKNISHDS